MNFEGGLRNVPNKQNPIFTTKQTSYLKSTCSKSIRDEFWWLMSSLRSSLSSSFMWCMALISSSDFLQSSRNRMVTSSISKQAPQIYWGKPSLRVIWKYVYIKCSNKTQNLPEECRCIDWFGQQTRSYSNHCNFHEIKIPTIGWTADKLDTNPRSGTLGTWWLCYMVGGSERPKCNSGTVSIL